MTAGRVPRALAALVLVAGAVTALVLGRPPGSSGTAAEPGPAVTGSGPPATSAEPADQPQDDAAAGAPGDQPPRSEPEVVAARAITAWQQQDTAARADGLLAVTTAAYQEAAAGIEPSRVPTSPLAATSLRVEADGQALVDARLEDGTALVALVVQVDDAWLVDDLQPADDPDAGTP